MFRSQSTFPTVRWALSDPQLVFSGKCHFAIRKIPPTHNIQGTFIYFKIVAVFIHSNSIIQNQNNKKYISKCRWSLDCAAGPTTRLATPTVICDKSVIPFHLLYCRSTKY